MLDGLTFAEVALVILYRVEEALALWAVFPNFFGIIYGDFILQL